MHPFKARLRAAATLALFATGVGACFTTDPIVARCFDIQGFPRDCLVFTTFPQTTDYILKGDTVNMQVFSDSGLNTATYTLTGDAIRFVVGSTLATSITTPSATAVIRGIAKGQGTVVATSASTSHSNTVVIKVADSTDVVDLDFSMNTTTLRAGDSLVFSVQLKDAAAATIQGDPTAMSTSSSTIADVVEHNVMIFGNSFRIKYLRGKTPGTTRLRGEFLAASDSISVTITP